MPPPGRGLTRSDTLTTIAQAANILPLRDFRANYVQTQHAEWKRHYIDCDEVAALLRQPEPEPEPEPEPPDDVSAAVPAVPPALVLLEQEVAKAQLFCTAQTSQIGAALESLRHEIADIAAAEKAAGLDSSAGEFFEDERNMAKKRGWRLWLNAELLEAFASLNCEAAARLARSVEACTPAGDEEKHVGERWLQESLALRKLGDVAAAVVPHKQALRNVLAESFFGGNVTYAEGYLRRIDRRTATRRTIFLAGFACGFCLCFAAGLSALLPEHIVWSSHFMFYTYRSAGLIALSLCLWALNIVIFETHAVNHVFILQTNPERYLHPSELVEFGAIWTVLLLLAFWLQASNAVLELDTVFQGPPIAVWCVVIAAFVMPFGKTTGHWLWSSRHMLWSTLGRVFAAPFYPVLFRDVLVGDILTSMVGVGKDLAHFMCFLQADAFGSEYNAEFLNLTAVSLLSTDACGCRKNEGWSLTEQRCTVEAVAHHRGTAEEQACARMVETGMMDTGSEHCKRYLGVDTWIALLPFWLRLLQCFRRHHDEAKAARAKGAATVSVTQLWNAAKYGTCIIVVFLSYADHVFVTSYPPPAEAASWDDAGWGARPYHSAWLVMVVVSTLFKLYWDIVHDWGFSLEFWKLRPTLLYPRCVRLGYASAPCLWYSTAPPLL
jgi:hypothetical protein